jgi:excinuclease ABC subunit A
MTVRKAAANNLAGADIRLPLGVLAGVCGVSGSGKSSLVVDIVARALAPVRLTSSVAYDDIRPGAHEAIEGAPASVVSVDQSIAGLASPGASLGILPALRRVYAGSAEAAFRSVDEAALVPGCDACAGRGVVREEMGFLPTLERPCDACDATGYRAEARELRLRGHSLPELERLELAEVARVWSDHGDITRRLAIAASLGLGYLVLGQRSGTLSGGEVQRLKLVKALAARAAGPTLYILDEPTVGLHPDDIGHLVRALEALVERGHGVLVVEHDTDLLAACDVLLELGPGGGPDGGRVIATGTPEEIAAGDTPTAPYLRSALGTARIEAVG